MFIYTKYSISIDLILIPLMIIINVNDNVENDFYFLLIALFHNCDVYSVPIADVYLEGQKDEQKKKLLSSKCNGFWD